MPSCSIPQVVVAVVKKFLDLGVFFRWSLPHCLLVTYSGHIAYVSDKEFSDVFCYAF